MKPLIRVFLWSCLALPCAAQGAVYKCTVDGKTAYQQHPCDTGADQRELGGGKSATKSPPAAASTGPAPALQARPPDPKAELDAAGREALARDAFAALKGRDLARFDALLCAGARTNYARPELKGVLPKAAAGIANRRTELGNVLVNEPKRVHFATTISEPGGSAAARVPDTPFSVGLDRDPDGRTCVSGFGSVAGKGA